MRDNRQERTGESGQYSIDMLAAHEACHWPDGFSEDLARAESRANKLRLALREATTGLRGHPSLGE